MHYFLPQLVQLRNSTSVTAVSNKAVYFQDTNSQRQGIHYAENGACSPGEKVFRFYQLEKSICDQKKVRGYYILCPDCSISIKIKKKKKKS